MLAAVLYFLAQSWVELAALKPVALAILVIFFALYNYAGNFCRFGDFS